MKNISSAYTLIELSIVMTIIGVLITITMSGKDLYHNSKTKSLLKQFKVTDAAVSFFKSSYQALPGDMSSATRYWSETTNGDGDGTIEYALDGSYEVETLRAFEQLSLSDLLVGNFCGSQASSSDTTCQAVATGKSGGRIDINIPKTTYEGVGLYIDYIDYASHLGSSNHWVIAGKEVADNQNSAAALTPKTVYLIDLKFDDSYPETGNILANGSATTCYDASSPKEYQQTTSTVTCTLAYKITN